VTSERKLEGHGDGKSPMFTIKTQFKLKVMPYDARKMAEIIANLGKKIQNAEKEQLIEVATSLAAIKDEQVIPHLRVALAKGDYQNMNPAIDGLAQVPCDAAADALLIGLASVDHAVAERAGKALQNMGKGDWAVDRKLKDFDSTDEAVRTAATRALGWIYSTHCYEPLCKRLNDKTPSVRCAAAEALGIRGEERAVGVLKACLADNDYAFRLAAVKGLLALKQPLDTDWLTPIIRAGDGRLDYFHEAIRLMRLKGGKNAAPAMASCLHFDDPSVIGDPNFWLIMGLEACQDGPKYYYKWHHDPNRQGTAEEIEDNKKILNALKAYLEAQK
jgi:hypothetical protein